MSWLWPLVSHLKARYREVTNPIEGAGIIIRSKVNTTYRVNENFIADTGNGYRESHMFTQSIKRGTWMSQTPCKAYKRDLQCMVPYLRCKCNYTISNYYRATLNINKGQTKLVLSNLDWPNTIFKILWYIMYIWHCVYWHSSFDFLLLYISIFFLCHFIHCQLIIVSSFQFNLDGC